MSKPFKEINLKRNKLVIRTGLSKLKVVQCEKGYSKVINKKIKKNDSNLLKDGFLKFVISAIQNKILTTKSKKINTQELRHLSRETIQFLIILTYLIKIFHSD